MIKKIIVSSLVSAALITMAQAEETPFVSHAELGYTSTSGNTQTDTFTFDGNVKKAWDEHSLFLKADAQYAKDKETELKNKIFTELKYDYAFADTLSFDYIVGYKNDKFSGYSYQSYTGPGVKYKAIVNKEHNLDLTGSILYAMDEVEGATDKDTYSSYKAEANYAWQIMETLKFAQDLTYRASFEEADNYFIYSKSALSTKISDMFSAGISYKIDYTNLAPVGNEKSDKTLAVNLILDY